MRKFWVYDDFIRKYARYLSTKAQIIYIALCSHANTEAETFVGCRKLGEELSMSKNTANKAIKELEAYHLVVRLESKNGLPSQLRVLTVPYHDKQPSQSVGHKEVSKEVSKEGEKKISKTRMEQMIEGKEKVQKEHIMKSAGMEPIKNVLEKR